MTTPKREVLWGFGRANHSRSLVYRPTSVEEVIEAVRDAIRRNLTVTHRGAGQSYGDAALNQGGAVVELTGLARVLSFNQEVGILRAEAGLSIDRLWRTTLPAGWWPPVVPGTSRPTLGGCVAMNVHGKNHHQSGAIGDHVLSLTVLTAEGELEILDRKDDEARLRQHVGTQGLFGTILDVTLQLRRIHSGYLAVEARSAKNLEEAMTILQLFSEQCDYAVGWLDCFSGEPALGRAELHGGSHLPRDHPSIGTGLYVDDQRPSPRVLGILSRKTLASLLSFVVHDLGIRQLNQIKFIWARARHPSHYLQPHAHFHFLLDYVPGWERAYDPGGLIQYQLFIPEHNAYAAFREALVLQRKLGVYSYLGVLKRHRAEPYPNSYSVDGYSLALDFPVRRNDLGRLMALTTRLDQLQAEMGGRVYAAKDAVSRIGRLPAERSHLYSSNLSRRWEDATQE